MFGVDVIDRDSLAGNLPVNKFDLEKGISRLEQVYVLYVLIYV